MNRLFVSLVFVFAAASAHGECSVATLSCPANAVAASLTSSDCVASDASAFDLWQFAGTAGDEVTVEMHATDFDTYLVLLNPDGVPVFDSDDLASASTDSRMHVTLPQGGTWTIVANSLLPSQLGSYTLSVTCPSSTPATPAPRRRAVGHGG